MTTTDERRNRYAAAMRFSVPPRMGREDRLVAAAMDLADVEIQQVGHENEGWCYSCGDRAQSDEEVAPLVYRLRAEIETLRADRVMHIGDDSIRSQELKSAELRVGELEAAVARVEGLLATWSRITYPPSSSDYDRGRGDQRHLNAAELAAALEGDS